MDPILIHPVTPDADYKYLFWAEKGENIPEVAATILPYPLIKRSFSSHKCDSSWSYTCDGAGVWRGRIGIGPEHKNTKQTDDQPTPDLIGLG